LALGIANIVRIDDDLQNSGTARRTQLVNRRLNKTVPIGRRNLGDSALQNKDGDGEVLAVGVRKATVRCSSARPMSLPRLGAFPNEIPDPIHSANRRLWNALATAEKSPSSNASVSVTVMSFAAFPVLGSIGYPPFADATIVELD
jgi:hypothetical protein